MFRSALLLLAALAAPALACAADTVPTATVTLAVSAAHGMTADYRLSGPVTRLEFERHLGAVRGKLWKLASAGLKLDGDALVTQDGKPFREFRVEVQPYTDVIDLDYAPMQLFSDGSVALFSGYFNVKGGGKATRFTFKDASRVLVYGRPAVAGESIQPESDGTFFYFGRLEPVQTGDSILILDPGLPAWAGKALAMQVPATIAFYTGHYGAPLPRRPFLLFNWKDRDAQGVADYKGDTLPSNIDFILSGAGWAQDTPDTRGLLATLITHEIAHLWNAYLFQPQVWSSDGGSWLPEGQAQAAAIEFSMRNGWISRADALQLYASALNACLRTPGDRPIQEQNQSNEAVYGCGVTFNLLAEAALHRKDARLGFFDLWHEIYADAGKQEYSEATFMGAVRKLSGDAELTDLLHALVTASAKDKNPRILAALERLGVGYAVPGPGSDNPEFGRMAITPVMLEAMRADCHGGVSLNTQDEGFLLFPVKNCSVLGKSYFVQAMDGQRLFAGGIAAYQAVAAGCARGEPIRLTVKEQEEPLLLPCPAKLPSMPDMVELTGVPWLDTGTAPETKL
ncbi:MAG TPA: hypothetical protein VF651_06960 [Gammaproteobacteria bacterium]